MRIRVASKDRQLTRSLTVPCDGPNIPRLSRWIPVPDVPTFPILTRDFLKRFAAPRYPNVMDVGSFIQVSLARYAITLAFRAMGLGQGERVLTPAYHCDTMIAPIVHVGAQPIFYRLSDDLSVDIDDLVSKIDRQTRVVLAVHYFGFHQNMARLREVCDERGLFLLEDCAHAFFGQIDGSPIGSYGDYAVASLWKFFPVVDGGCLVSRYHSLDGLSLFASSLNDNIKSLSKMVDLADYYGTLGPLHPVWAGLIRLRNLLRGNTGAEDENGPITFDGPTDGPADMPLGADYDLAVANKRMTSTSRLICAMASRSGSEIAHRRRRNYERLVEGSSRIVGCRPLFDELANDVVPFMFPLWVNNLARVFSHLEDAALPMQRFGQFLWPGVDKTTCPVSARLSKGLILLPCHQELEGEEIDWLLTTIRSVISN